MKHRIRSTCFIFIITAALLISGHNTVFAVGEDTGVKTDTLQLPPNPPQTPQTSTDHKDIKIKDFGNFPAPQDPGVKFDTPDLPSADRDAQKKMETVQEKYKSELKKDCLPLPDNLNINDNISFGVMQVIDRYKGEPCEMMNEIKFHLDEKRGKNAGQIAWKMIDIFVIPDEGDALELLAKIFAKHAAPVAGIYSKLSDAKQFIELIDSEIETNRLHGQYLEAVNAYQSSKGWNMTQLKNETGSLYTDLKHKLKQVEKLESELYAECMKHYPSYQELADYGPPVKPGTKIPNDAEIWRRYYEKIEPIERKYDYEIRSRLKEIAGIELKIKFLEKYRKPLIEKPCKEMIAELQKNCPQKTVETKPDTKPKEPDKNEKVAAPKSKEELFGCICKCTINPTVGVGATYDPKAWKNASPSCDDARNGPCVGFGLGCWRRHMESEGKCFDQCIAAAKAKPQEVKAEIYQTKFKAYNDFLGEARSIMEEYLAYKAGLYQKKSDRGGWGINRDFILLAGNFPDDASLGQILFAAAPAGSAPTPTPYTEMVREKNRRGDPDRALGLVRAAESVMPDRKSSGETTNILAEFAIIMAKTSLNIVTEFEFDEGLYLLRKAAAFYSVGKSNPLGENIQRLTKGFEKWKEDWQILKREIPACLALIKDKRVCECDRLNSEKITPASNSLTIYEFASSEKWSISTANGTPRSLPEKDKIYNELKDKLSMEKNECANNPAMNTKEMKDLTDYETRKFLEKSPYINQEDLKKNSAPVICDTRAVKNAEKLLSAPGLCDCQQEKIKGILDTAKKDARPLAIEFGADKKELAVGERVMINLSIKGGLPPFSVDMIGDYSYNMRSEARGFNINYQADKAGTNNFYVTVVDSCGDSGSKKVSIYVKPSQSSKTLPPTTKETTKTSSPTQIPNSIKKQPPVYDPTKDPSYTPDGKTIDTAQIDSLGKTFQDTHINIKKPDDTQQGTQGPLTPQPPPPTDTATSKGSDSQNTAYPPPSPPYAPPSDNKGITQDWSKWASNKTDTKAPSHEPSTHKPPKDSTTSSTSTTSATSTTSTTSTTTDVYVTAKITNRSKQDAHIFAEGESFGPGNRFGPGEKNRPVNVKVPSNNKITFHAGRNGQVIASKAWYYDPAHPGRFPDVIFDDSKPTGYDKLGITTGLR